MPVVFRLDMQGVDKMVGRLRSMGANVDRVEREILEEEAKDIMASAVTKYVPAFMNDLRTSGRISKVRKQGNITEISMGFGSGRSKRYALAVHEHPSSHSPRSWQGKSISDIRTTLGRTPWSTSLSGGRGPKYLERPMKFAFSSGEFLNRVAKRLEKALKRKG